jgi:SPP1 family phage portal protein
LIENSTRCGSFEKHISIVDAIESILSNSVNEIDYFDNAYLHLKGIVNDLNDLDALGTNLFEEMKSNRTLVTLADGDAKFLIKDINDTYIQNTLDRLTKDYHKLTKTPALSDENFGNASGVSLKYKLFNLEKDMSKKESKWRKSIQRMLELITTIQNLKGMNFDYRDIKITFTRALPNNEVEVADIITKLNGIVSHKTLLSQLDFIENPDAELELIAKEKQEYMDQLDIYSNPAQTKDDTESNQDEADSNQTEDEDNVDSNNKDGE